MSADSAAPDRARRVVAAVAVAALATVAAVVVPRLDKGRDRPATVLAGGDAAPEPALPAPATPTLDVQIPAGWQTLRADRDLLVVGTRPLNARDLLLALLARDDAAFTAFPSDGTVFVVGRDRLKAKYTGGVAIQAGPPSGVSPPLEPGTFVGPGPALAFGPPKALPGGVTARLGDVPQSSVILAAYTGSRALAAHLVEAEAMAATVRYIPPPPGVIPPPPPPGSRLGFDAGGVDINHQQLADAVAFSAPGVTYAARAEGDCAVVVASDSPQPMAGGCRARPAAAASDVVAVMTDPGPPPRAPAGARPVPTAVPQWGDTMLVLARVGPDVRRVTAVRTDGRTVDLAMGAGGWALGATDGRMFLLEARDRAGQVLAVTPIT